MKRGYAAKCRARNKANRARRRRVARELEQDARKVEGRLAFSGTYDSRNAPAEVVYNPGYEGTVFTGRVSYV